MEISQDEDNKVALKALELLGKASDLFTERSEITITHKTSDELKAAIKARIQMLMQNPMKQIPTENERRLAELSDQNITEIDVVDMEIIPKDE
jgi:DNA anti-recombination protein RmuC